MKLFHFSESYLAKLIVEKQLILETNTVRLGDSALTRPSPEVVYVQVQL